MAAEFDDTIKDSFLIAQYANWAGDFDYAQQLYASAAGRGITEPAKRAVNPINAIQVDNVGTLNDLIKFVADRRETRIAETRANFAVLVNAFNEDAIAVTTQPRVLETRQLRGTVWRVSPREFEMRAYVTAIENGQHVLRRARQLAGRDGVQDQLAAVPGNEAYKTEFYTWDQTGNPFLNVVVTGLLFIEVKAFWTGKRPPARFALVEKRLQAVLNSLST